jgi:MoaA/NifB/PqqE/SkfB family radical SAM enzyme
VAYNNLIDLGIELSQNCDKGCATCCNLSTPKGAQMEAFLLEQTIGEIKGFSSRYDAPLTVGLCGGEPLLYSQGYHDVVSVARDLLSSRIPITICTSGRLVGEPERFRNVVHSLSGTRTGYSLSANLYMRGGMERVRDSIEDLRSEGIKNIYLAMTFDRDNYVETFSQFNSDVLLELGHSVPLPFVNVLGGDTSEIDGPEGVMGLRKGDEQLFVRIHHVRKGGRNRHGKLKPLAPNPGCYLLESGQPAPYILYDGTVLPCCSPVNVGGRNLVVGNLKEERLVDILMRADDKMDSIRKMLATVERDGSSSFDICEHCHEV